MNWLLERVVKVLLAALSRINGFLESGWFGSFSLLLFDQTGLSTLS
jgi:hypothetical protein